MKLQAWRLLLDFTTCPLQGFPFSVYVPANSVLWLIIMTWDWKWQHENLGPFHQVGCFSELLPSWYLLAHSQQWKHENNEWNLLNVNNKGARTTSVPFYTPLNMRKPLVLWCFQGVLLVNFTVLVSLFLTLNRFHT